MKLRRLWALALFFCISNGAVAQDRDTELNQIIEALRAQGMSEEQIQQMQQQLAPMIELEKKQRQQRDKAAKDKAQNAAKEAERLKELAQGELSPSPGQLQLAVGEEISTLNLVSCSFKQEIGGGAQLTASAHAVGDFRGSPAIVSLGQIRPGSSSHYLYVRLAALNDEEVGLGIEQALAARSKSVDAWQQEQQELIQKQYPITDDMSLDQLNAAMEASNRANRALSEQAEAKRTPMASSTGEISITPKTANFEGNGLYYAGRGRTPDAFLGSEGLTIYAQANCEEP